MYLNSIGVSHQYCGNLGKTANGRVAVNLSLATECGSVPLDYRLYPPKAWADDSVRRTKTGVPQDVGFATKPQIKAAVVAGMPLGVVLVDAAYGDETGWRDLGMPYMVGVRPATTV